MSLQIEIPAEVKRQLRGIARWYRDESGSSDVAQAWFDGMCAALESLRHNPERCGLAHEDVDFPFELRELLYGSGRKKTHRALFRVDGATIVVLAIRHVAQRDVTRDEIGA